MALVAALAVRLTSAKCTPLAPMIMLVILSGWPVAAETALVVLGALIVPPPVATNPFALLVLLIVVAPLKFTVATALSVTATAVAPGVSVFVLIVPLNAIVQPEFEFTRRPSPLSAMLPLNVMFAPVATF